MVDEMVPPLGGGVEIAHAVSGRVRLRVLENCSQQALKALTQNLQQLQGMEKVLKNDVTGSLLLTFDTNRLSLSELLTVLKGWGVSVGVETVTEANEALAWSEALSQAYTKLHSFLPLVVGILTTRQLGIQGWPSFPVYLMTTSLTRQILKQFESEQADGDQEITPDREEHLTAISATALTEKQKQPSKVVACDVVHAIPGRIRFHLPGLAQQPDYLEQLEELIKAETRITSLRIKKSTQSLLITYQPEELSTDQMISRLKTLIKEAREKKMVATEIAATTTRSLSQRESNNVTYVTETSSSFLTELDPTKNVNQVTPANSTAESSLQPTLSAEVRGVDKLPQLEDLEQSSSNIMPEEEEASAEQASYQVSSDTIARLETRQDIAETKVLERSSPWSYFKPAALCAMLRFMANQPLRKSAYW